MKKVKIETIGLSTHFVRQDSFVMGPQASPTPIN